MSARMRWILLSIAAVAVAGSGCGGGGSSTGTPAGGGPDTPPISTVDTAPPTVSPASLSPSVLSFTGGSVRVTVDATDSGSGVAQVWVDVVNPAGLETRVALAAGATAGRFEGGVSLPPNASSTGTPAVYTLKAGAEDVSHNVAAAQPVAVTVQAALAPPPVPPPGF